MSLTLSAGLAAQPRLLELAPELGARLGGTEEVWRTADHDILLRISGLTLAGLSPLAAERPTDVPTLLPIGVLPGRETLYANWRGLGHVLVAGLPGGGVETVLTSVVGALTARCRPEEVRLVTIASRRTLPSAIFGLPHQSDAAVDPVEQDAVAEILQELRDELDRRMRRRSDDGSEDDHQAGDQPEIVVVIGELADIAVEATTFELLGVHGAAHGIRLLAASTRPEAVGEELLAHFATRVALQTLDEDASIRLIGRPDAADLGGGGDLLVRIDGRVPTARPRVPSLARAPRSARRGDARGVCRSRRRRQRLWRARRGGTLPRRMTRRERKSVRRIIRSGPAERQRGFSHLGLGAGRFGRRRLAGPGYISSDRRPESTGRTPPLRHRHRKGRRATVP